MLWQSEGICVGDSFTSQRYILQHAAIEMLLKQFDFLALL